MVHGDNINTHVNKVLALANLLKDLGKPVAEDMIISKIFSSLPPSYNSIIAAWTNLADRDRTVQNLKTRLLQMENILSLQNGNVESLTDKAFFSRTNRHSSSSTSNTSKNHRQEQKDRNKEHLRHLKENSLCYNCGKPRHWRDECPEPPRFDSKRSENFSRNSHNRKQSDANAATSQPLSYNSDDSDSNSAESDSYAFMTVSRHSQALSVNLDSRTWWADTGATEHMTEHRDWFTNFTPVDHGTWSVAVADDRDVWVLGIGDINIMLTIDGCQHQGVLRKVLYVPELRRNLFSIGLASLSGISFVTLGSTCALYRNLGNGPKIMEGVRVGTLYQLSFYPIPPEVVVSSTTQALITTTSRPIFRSQFMA